MGALVSAGDFQVQSEEHRTAPIRAMQWRPQVGAEAGAVIHLCHAPLCMGCNLCPGLWSENTSQKKIFGKAVG